MPVRLSSNLVTYLIPPDTIPFPVVIILRHSPPANSLHALPHQVTPRVKIINYPDIQTPRLLQDARICCEYYSREERHVRSVPVIA